MVGVCHCLNVSFDAVGVVMSTCGYRKVLGSTQAKSWSLLTCYAFQDLYIYYLIIECYKYSLLASILISFPFTHPRQAICSIPGRLPGTELLCDNFANRIE